MKTSKTQRKNHKTRLSDRLVRSQSSSSMTLVPSPLSPSAGISATVTSEKNSSLASSSSFLLRATRTLILLGGPLIPLLHICLFNFTSTLTSFVPMAFSANFLISLMAFGAFFLKVLLQVKQSH